MAKPRTPKKTAPATDPIQSTALSPENTVTAPPALQAEPKTNGEVKRAARKPEIVRPDSRATVIPINLEEEIRSLAYLYSERRGFQPGHEAEDWLAAEREVMQRYHQQSA